ncbi:MAG: GLUG motif-containing protein [Planctomycetota bacterium]|jgi:hypothetical protein
MADIDLSGYVYDRAVIAPLTSNTRYERFTGVFEGSGHTISHLTISGDSNLGLFGGLGSGARISNLGLGAVDVNGIGGFIGGLAGSGEGSVAECSSSGTVCGGDFVGGLIGEHNGGISTSYSTATVQGNDWVGGLVGMLKQRHAWRYGFSLGFSVRAAATDATVSDCYGSGAVTGNEKVGGLVGQNEEGKITRSYSTGDVVGNVNVGGLVGYNDWNFAHISMCYSTGTVNGGTHVGGLVGCNSWAKGIETSFSTGEVVGDLIVGGLVGANYASRIRNSYSTGAVSGNEDVGGLIGTGSPDSVISAFWNIDTSGQAASPGGTGLTTAEMQTASTFLEAGWDFIDETENGTDDIWWVDEGQDYPRLWWELDENEEAE